MRTYRFATLSWALLAVSGAGLAQPNPVTDQPAIPEPEEEIILLSPFEVSAADESGYAAATTLAGNRLNTELRDIGNAVTVITSQFLKDIAATNNESLLQYTTGTEVGNAYGNFAGVGDGAVLDESSRFTNPNTNTRVRGLSSADNTRDFFLTDIPWDGYNVDRVDMQRGANSILFGQGSPAGIINTGLRQAAFKDSNQVVARYGSFGSSRSSIDINRVLIKGELGVRISGLYNDERFKQEPAFSRDERLYGALRWEPAFLKRGGARTIFKANYEAGEVQSNRPRSLPPIDLITPWFLSGTSAGRDSKGVAVNFNNLDRRTFNPIQLQDGAGLPNRGQARSTYSSGVRNPEYQPWIGGFGQQNGGVLAYFDGSSDLPANYWVAVPAENGGINGTGQIDRDVGGLPFMSPASIASYQTYAKNARLPFSEFGVYKDFSLSDPTVFDFYNNLLDGPNKSEWQNFTHYNLNLAQTFFDDRFGFEVTYDNEKYRNGQVALLHGERQGIYVDINSVYSDGSVAGKDGIIGQDGTPNPNVGRAFVSDSGQFGNNSLRSEREAARLTAFATHDFTRNGRRTWWRRALGQHTVTGLVGKDTNTRDTRSWIRWGTDDAYRAFVNLPDANAKFNVDALVPNAVIYMGPSLSNRTTASGAYLPRIEYELTPASGTVHAFNSTWKGGADPAAFWSLETVGQAPAASVQAENPANYVGWGDVPFKILDSEKGYRDYLTTNARLAKSIVTSRVAVWQGHLWDNAIVGTFGVRKDIAKSWSYTQDVNSKTTDRYGHLDFSPAVFRLPEEYANRLEVTSRSWSAVAHLTQFIRDRSPVRVSAFFSKSENFQPAANRVDVYGQPLGAPMGDTKDVGLLFQTRDNKYSLKLNKYETKSINQSSNALSGAWFIGQSQSIYGGNWANIFEYDIASGSTIQGRDPNPNPNNFRYNYAPAVGETLADAQAREARAVAGWRAWQQSVDPRFYTAWGININDLTKDITNTAPQGFAVTEDAVSNGYEIELTAEPTSNWRLALNATKSTAKRTNIGGAALTEFVTEFETALRTTGAGDLRIWYGGAGNSTMLQFWNQYMGSEWAQRKLQEGSDVPELREWRFNGIANYSFDDNVLKGVSVGTGVRYESDIVIGYKPIQGATAQEISYDLANPYKGPSSINYDFWIGYKRKLTKQIRWQLQLNLRNAFAGNELIPINTQPDGTPAGYRIRPPRTWTLTNTFDF